jgi:type I restriction enzyme S subunit
MTPTQEQNVPNLRFPEFKDNENNGLQNVLFADLFSFSSGKNIKQDEASPDFKTPCVRYGELYHLYGEVIKKVINKTNIPSLELRFSDGDEILIPSAGEDPLDIGSASALTLKGVAIGRTINVLKPLRKNEYSPVFASYYINSSLRKQISCLARGSSISNVYNSDLKTLKINLPTLPEQRKIAEFLGVVDEKIEQLSCKRALLEGYKKGCMQQLFSQEIRFKNDNGNDFPDWEEKRLGWVFEERKTYMSKGHDLPHVSLTVKGVVPKSERYERDFLVRQEDKQYKITYENDICYNPANLKFGVICRNKFGSGIFSPIYCTFEVAKEYDPRFVEALITSADFIKRIRRYEEGTVYERMAVKPADFILGIEKFPHLAEQRKIADFLSALDHKIELVAQELTLARSFKAGLLQQMFI